MNRRTITACCLALIALTCGLSGPGCNKGGGGQEGASGKLRIAVIPKGATHDFWKSVQTGAQDAGRELGVDIIWKAPLKEDDMADEIAIVQQFVSENVSGIVLAPLDSKGLVRPVRAAAGQKIPVVIMDSPLQGEPAKDFVAFVGTNNRNAGKLAGDEMARVLGGKGKVVMIRYNPGSASTEEREAGFMDAMGANPGIQVISSDQYAGATEDSAKQKSQDMLDTLRQADGIFLANESSTLGTLITLRQAGLTKGDNRKKFVGFDATKPLVDAVEAGELDAVVAQNPTKMGHDAVVAVVHRIQGKDVPVNEDTGAVLITKDKLNDPDIKALLKR